MKTCYYLSFDNSSLPVGCLIFDAVDLKCSEKLETWAFNLEEMKRWKCIAKVYKIVTNVEKLLRLNCEIQ